MNEIYFVPTKSAAPMALKELQRRFIAEGLPCTLEQDSIDTCWMVFEPHELNIYASTIDDVVTLATVNFGLNDDTTIQSTVERIMTSIGFSADEEADYM